MQLGNMIHILPVKRLRYRLGKGFDLENDIKNGYGTSLRFHSYVLARQMPYPSLPGVQTIPH